MKSYTCMNLDRTAQEEAHEMPVGGFSELRDNIYDIQSAATDAANAILDAATPAELSEHLTVGNLNKIASYAIARLYTDQPASRPGPIARMSLAEADELIDTGVVRLYWTKNTNQHPEADQTASVETRNALRQYRDCCSYMTEPNIDNPFLEDPQRPFWVSVQANEHPRILKWPERWLTHRLQVAFKHTNVNVTPTNIRRLAETIVSEAAFAGAISTEARNHMLIAQQHSARTANVHYVKRRRMESARKAADVLEAAIQHENNAASNEQNNPDNNAEDNGGETPRRFCIIT